MRRPGTGYEETDEVDLELYKTETLERNSDADLVRVVEQQDGGANQSPRSNIDQTIDTAGYDEQWTTQAQWQ